MENNIIKGSYLEVLPEKEIIKSNNSNILPIIKADNNLLLPVIMPKKEMGLIEIKKNFNILKKHKNITKILLKAIAKFIRFCFMAIASIVGFIGVSVLIIMSTAIITKNIVNSYYGTTPQEDTTYSIFKMKNDIGKDIQK